MQVWQEIFDFSQSSSTGLKPVRGPASPSEISGSKSWVFSACIVMRCVFQSLSQLLAHAPSISISATNQLWKSSQADAVNLIKLNWNLSQWPEKKIHTCAGAVKRLSEQGPAKPKSRGCVNNVKGQGSRVWAEGPALPCAPPAAFKSLHVENLGSISHADPPCLRL